MIDYIDYDRIVVFRVDCTKAVGGGHLSRCLTLAKSLKHKNIPSLFLTISDNYSNESAILSQGHHCVPLNCKNLTEDAHQTSCLLKKLRYCSIVLVIDHYTIDSTWISKVRDFISKIVVIDDLADRKLDCDLLINQVYNMKPQSYCNLVPSECQLLLGSKFAILRSQFLKMRTSLEKQDPPKHVKRVNLLFGSGDPFGLSLVFSQNILANFKGLEILVNTTENSSNIKGLKSLASFSNSMECVINSSNVAHDMSRCQFAVGTPGMSTWERACLGLPSIQIGSSTNQIPIMKMLHKQKICHWLGMPDNFHEETFVILLEKLIHDSQWRDDVRKTCMSAIDGRGTDRVTNSISHLFKII